MALVLEIESIDDKLVAWSKDNMSLMKRETQY